MSSSSGEGQGQGAAAELAVTADSPVRGVSVTGNMRRLLSHVRVENLAAGLSGGVVSTMVLHPLDLVKIRFAGEVSFLHTHVHLRHYKYRSRLSTGQC